MNTTLISGGILAMGALVGGALGLDGAQTLSRPAPEYLQVASLDVAGGKVRQSHIHNGRANIPATWAARIEKEGRVVCDGSSHGAQSSYRANFLSPDEFTPKEWSGDPDCGIEADDADAFEAEWQYVTRSGLIVTIIARREYGD